MALAFFDSPSASAGGVARTVQVPASDYGGANNPTGMSASTGVGLYNATSGAVPYMVYNPSTAALTAFGWQNLPLRVLVYIGTLSSVATDGGTGTTPATNIGLHMTEQGTASLGGKLGYGTANDGSLQSAVQNWPTLVVCIQGPNNWFPAGSGAATRGWWMMHDAVIRDVIKKYNVDTNFFYLTGCSGGGGTFMEYLLASTYWPSRFPVRYAAVTTLGGSFSGSGTRQDWPEGIPGETSTTQTFPRLTRRMVLEMGTPWWEVHSRGDAVCDPTTYNNWINFAQQYWPTVGTTWTSPFAATLKQHGRNFRFLEYTGGVGVGPSHPATFDTFYGDETLAGAMNPNGPWARWMFDKSIKSRRPAQPANQRLALFAGGSNGPVITSSASVWRRRR